jgi:uncharacterized protein YndB with AHSA1/START domain
MTEQPLRYVRVLPAPVERVWRALTTPEQLDGWLPGVSRIELVPGGRVWFSASPATGAVTILEPPRMLRVEGSDPAPRYLQFELESVAPGTRLTFSAGAAPEPVEAPTRTPQRGFVAGLDCLGEMLGAGVSAVEVQALTSLSRDRVLELVAVYYDQIWQKCDV